MTIFKHDFHITICKWRLSILKEQSAFYTKKEKDEKNVDDEKTSKNRKSSRSAFDNNKILGILPEEPKEIRLNESVEELLKRFSYEGTL